MARIALVGNSDWGLLNFRLPLARALRDRGDEALFVCPIGKYTSQLRSEGFRVVEWPMGRLGVHPCRELVSMARLVRIYAREAPDIVDHIHVKPILYGTAAGLLTGVPLVVNTFTGWGYIFSRGREQRRIAGAVGALLRFLLKAPRVVSAFQTREDCDIFARLGLITRQRSRVIGTGGTDLAVFSPTADGRREESPPIVLMGARLLWDKGVSEFVAAAQILIREGWKARFCLAGAPDKDNSACVSEAQIESWRREGFVEFLGHRADIADLMRNASIAVLPSYHEGIPLFLVEAAASGLPIVASDIEGCRTVVEPGANGILVPPKDAAALAAGIRRLLSGPGLRRDMGGRSRRIALERFDNAKVVPEYLHVYGDFGRTGRGSSRPER